jgi:ATP-binding cassette subfamily B protein
MEDNLEENKIKVGAKNKKHGMGQRLIGGDKPKDLKGAIKNLVHYMSSYKKSFAVVFVLAVSSTVFSIVGPRILGNITNQIVTDYVHMTVYDQVKKNLPEGYVLPEGTKGEDVLKMFPKEALEKIPEDTIEDIKSMDFSSRPGINFEAIGQKVALLVGIYLLSASLSYLVEWIMSGVMKKVTYRFRKDVFNKISRLPLRYFDTHAYGDVLSRMTNDIDTISQTLGRGIIQIITSITMIIGILVMMIRINPILTLIAVVILPLSGLLISLVIRKSQKLFVQQQNYLGEVNGHIEEMYGGHNIVKAFNGEERSLQKFDTINEKLYNTAWKSQFLAGLLLPIMNILSNGGYVAVAVLGGKFVIEGKINIGDIQAFMQYMNQFTQPIVQTANISNIFQSMGAAAERVFEFLNEEEEKELVKDFKEIKNVKGNVTFENVKFGYTPEKIIIKGFSANVKAGQKVAIVGPTGAGKTTMVNLLMRFYDYDSGSIKIDGIEIKQIRREEVRKLFGMVLQDAWLFNGTIKGNISYSRPEATDEEIIQAAKNAYVDHFIHTLPDGYDTVISEEADNISQGEKQLLTIARAMLANPPMLILDEATSSVDTRTEILIQKAMDKLMEGKTTFVIAHRLSTIRNADLILVMDKGDIVEKGKHAELLKKNGFYASIYNSQFQLPKSIKRS